MGTVSFQLLHFLACVNYLHCACAQGNDGTPPLLPVCRKFTDFSPEALQACYRYLNKNKTYYLGDTEWLDNPRNQYSGFSVPGYFLDVFRNVLKPACFSNVEEHICHSWYKECAPLDDGSYLPALPCRSECEKRKVIWDDCVAQVRTDADLKGKFDTQMIAAMDTVATGSNFLFGTELPTGPSGVRRPFTFLECDAQGGENTFEEADASLAFTLGQMPFYSVKFPNWIISSAWPRNMEVQDMYPVLTSTYTFPTGTKVEVPCFAPNTVVEIQRTECPDSFVNPMDVNNVKPCVNPCPAAVYTDEEYSGMWATYNAIGLMGLLLNLFLVTTWYLGGKTFFLATPYQVIACVFGGILYAIVGTIPSLALKYDLPCSGCSTEECTGEGIACAVNRSAIYVLLFIQFHLCDLMRILHQRIVSGAPSSNQKKKARHRIFKALSTILPLVLLAISYGVEGNNDGQNENDKLNVTRHAFSCSMRFSNMVTEWALQWIHFVWSGAFTIFYSMKLATHTGVLSNKIKSQKKKTQKGPSDGNNTAIDAARKRLLRISSMSTVCLLMMTIGTVVVSVSLHNWSLSSDIWLTCTVSETVSTRNWANYGFLDAESSPRFDGNKNASTAFLSTEAESRRRERLQIGCPQERSIAVRESCTSACYWDPQVTLSDLNGPYMVCSIVEGPYEPSNDPFRHGGANLDLPTRAICDCPCSDLIEVLAPNLAIMALPYIAQAITVTIVGLNLAFRKTYFDVWKKRLLPKNYQASTAPQQYVILPHHGPNSGLSPTQTKPRRQK